jgi:hypothetical protein
LKGRREWRVDLLLLSRWAMVGIGAFVIKMLAALWLFSGLHAQTMTTVV